MSGLGLVRKMAKCASSYFGKKDKNEKQVRLLQWNVLADGLGDDGFLTTEFSPIFESADPKSKSYDAREFMNMVRGAKEADKASGMSEKQSQLKKEQKKLKKMKPGDEGYDDLQAKISKLEEETDQSELVKLKKRFQHSPQLQRVDKEILAWDVRYQRLKDTILRFDPDVITLQEIDHVKQFLQDKDFSMYTCMHNAKKPYTVPNYTGQKEHDDLSPKNYLQHLLDAQAAFAPKSYSNAYSFRKKRGGDLADIDDDGCAIFWKKDILKPTELGFLKMPSDSDKSEAVVALTLEFIKGGQKLNVLTTHLPSGDEPSKELERLAVMKNPSAEWTARHIKFDGISWKEEPYQTKTKFDGIASFVAHFAEGTVPTIFALDANSRPSFPPVQSESFAAKTNVWQTILNDTKLESIWVNTSYLDVNGKPQDKEYSFVASVNKMRGPSSNQPPKIGEHQLELIDHVFTNCKKSTLVGDKNHDAPIAPLLYKSKGDAELDLYPNSKMPSDHVPVVVDITL